MSIFVSLKSEFPILTLFYAKTIRRLAVRFRPGYSIYNFIFALNYMPTILWCQARIIVATVSRVPSRQDYLAGVEGNWNYQTLAQHALYRVAQFLLCGQCCDVPEIAIVFEVVLIEPLICRAVVRKGMIDRGVPE